MWVKWHLICPVCSPAELTFIRDIKLFVRLFFSPSPELDGVRVTKRRDNVALFEVYQAV